MADENYDDDDFHLTDDEGEDNYEDDNFEDDEDFQKFLDAKDDAFLETPKRLPPKATPSQIAAFDAEQQADAASRGLLDEALEPYRVLGKEPERRFTRGEAQRRLDRWRAIQAAGHRFTEVEAELFDLPPQPVSLLFYGARGPFFHTATLAVGPALASHDAQTDPVGFAESSAQAPEFSLDLPGQQPEQGGATSRRGNKQAAGAGAVRVQLEMGEMQQKHLAIFVQAAAPFAEAVADAWHTERLGTQDTRQIAGAAPSPSGSVADGVVPFSHPIVEGRRAVALALSPPSRSQPWQALLVAYGPKAGAAAPAEDTAGRPWGYWRSDWNLDRCSLLCTWSLEDPTRPRHVCIAEGAPSCCCWGPADSGASFVACGDEEGALSIWDLTEAEETHEARSADGICLRIPTYSSESDPLAAGSASRVVRLAPSAGLSRGDDGGCLFSLLSLDEWGCVSQWDVVRAGRQLAAGAARLAEAGLRFGGRARLDLARAGFAYSPAAIAAAAAAAAKGAAGPGEGPASPMSPLRRWGAGAGGELGIEAFDLCLLCGEENSTLFAVATDEGTVRLGTPVGRLPAPSVLTPDPDGSVRGADLGPATSVHAHPLFPEVLAVGFAFGGVCVFHSSSRKPIRRWSCATGDGGAAVLSARWSAVRGSLLLVLDAAGGLRLFDVLGEGDEPVHEERVAQGSSGADRPTAMEVSSQPICHAASVRKQVVAVSFESGAVAAYVVDSKVGLLGPEEFMRLDAALRSPYKS